MKRAAKVRVLSAPLSRGKPRQFIKVVHGLRGDENHITHMRLIGDDSTLMDMDAPVCIPTGAMKAYLGLDRKFLFVTEDVYLRDDTEWERHRRPSAEQRA